MRAIRGRPPRADGPPSSLRPRRPACACSPPGRGGGGGRRGRGSGGGGIAHVDPTTRVDRVPRQPARNRGRPLGRHLLAAQPRLEVPRARRAGLRGAARGHRARLRRDRERHHLRAGRQHRGDPVVDPRGDPGAVGRPPVRQHQPDRRHHRHAGDRHRPRRDLRGGRRAERWRAGPRPGGAEHVHRLLHAGPGRRPPGPTDNGRDPAAHRAEPEQRATWSSGTAATTATARPTAAGSSRCPRAVEPPGLLPGGAARQRRGRVDGRRRTRGRRGGQHLGGHGERVVVDPLRLQRLGARAVAGSGSHAVLRPERLVRRQRRRPGPRIELAGAALQRDRPAGGQVVHRLPAEPGQPRRDRTVSSAAPSASAAATPTAATPSRAPSCTSPAAAGCRRFRPARSARSGRPRRGARPPDHGRRARLVDRRVRSLYGLNPANGADRVAGPHSAARPTTSRPRRWATACSWPRRPTRSYAFSGSAGLPGPPSPPPPPPRRTRRTGWPRRTAASSPSATPASSGRPAASR